MKLKNKALFLDRDGVINKNFGYVFSMKNFIWLKNVKKAIKYAYTKKYLIIVVTNQSGVARGFYSENDIKKGIVYKQTFREFLGNVIHYFKNYRSSRKLSKESYGVSS